MQSNAPSNPSATADRFYTMLKSLREFDRAEVRGVLRTLLSTTARERCFLGTYYRGSANVDSLLELRSASHFQAIAMLTRSLFELAVDIRLVDVVQDSVTKINEFNDVEKLRCARKILKYAAISQTTRIDTSIYSAFVQNNESRVRAAAKLLWPGIKPPSHWSGMRVRERVALLGAPLAEIYEVHYPRLSWYVHSGLTGVVNLKAETFTVLCAAAFKVAADSYWELLLAMIREFKIAKADEKIETKLKAARLLPFTDTPDEAEQLLRSLSQ
jgi:hypothetical protein